MPNRRTLKRSRGGAVIGQGTYGCGFFPGLNCKGETLGSKQLQTLFTKLMTKSNANTEYNINATIKSIDPQQKFSVYPFKMCNVDSNKFKQLKSEGIRSCMLIDSKLQNKNVINSINKGSYKLLQSPYGGPTLRSVILQQNKTKKTIIDILFSLDNLFKGLEHYHKHDFVHLDIKDDNIVVNSDGTSIRSKFIDFGLSSKIKDFDKIYNELVLHIPIDFIILIYWNLIFSKDGTMNIPTQFIEKHIKNIFDVLVIPLENIEGEIIDGKYVIADNSQAIMEHYIDILIRLLQFNDNNVENPSQRTKKLLLTSVDVYSLGVTLGFVLYNLFEVFMYYDVIYDNYSFQEVKKPLYDIPVSIIERLYNLVANMTLLDPFERYTITEARESFRQILKDLDRKRSIRSVKTRKTAASIRFSQMEKRILSKNRENALEPYLSSDVIAQDKRPKKIQ